MMVVWRRTCRNTCQIYRKPDNNNKDEPFKVDKKIEEKFDR